MSHRIDHACVLLAVYLLAVALIACGDEGPETPEDMQQASDMPADLPAEPEEMDMEEGADMFGPGEVDMRADMDDRFMACDQTDEGVEGLVVTEYGEAQGFQEENDVWAFLGLPYAAAPTGDLRWRSPRPHGCYAQRPFQAVEFGPECTQLNAQDNVVGSEDCLTLNVWTPAGYTKASRFPVLVFIHGGANLVGSASETLPLSSGQPIYSGKYFADKRDVVVVTIQYRLGVFGFLAHPDLTAEEATSGTYAHLDQIEALKWVQRNIARFGGDPSRVMLFGESAGAVNTCTLLASPLAKDLFSAALMQSGTCAAETLADIEAEHKAVTDTIAECAGATNTLDCLRRLPKETLARAMPSSVGVGADRGTPGSRVRFGPVVDGRLLTDDPIAVFRRGEHNKPPFAIGSNAEEMRESRLLTLRVSTAMEYENTIRLIGLAFGIGAADQILATYPVSDYPDPQTALEQVTTDASFTCPARSIARSLDAGQDDPVWRYFFSRQAELANGDRLPANHGIELIYVFESMRSIPGMRAQGDLNIADSMLNFWVNLAEFSTMNPPRVGGATWPEYDTARDTFLEFGDTVEAGEQLRAAKCNLWDSLVAGL